MQIQEKVNTKTRPKECLIYAIERTLLHVRLIREATSFCFILYRNFLPDMKEYFKEAFDQADPDSQIEEQYK